MYWWEWTRLIFDLLKSIAWPLLLLVLALIFRSDIKKLAARLLKASPTEIVWSPEQPVPPTAIFSGSAVSEEAVSASPKQQQDIAGTPQSIIEIRSKIPAEQLEPMFETARRALPQDVKHDQKTTIEFLLYAVTSLSLQLLNERNYRTIFGSQLELMSRANSGLGVEKSEAMQIREVAATRFPEQYENFPFDEWLKFPLSANLIVITPDERIAITPRGRGLLNYIIEMRLPAHKLM